MTSVMSWSRVVQIPVVTMTPGIQQWSPVMSKLRNNILANGCFGSVLSKHSAMCIPAFHISLVIFRKSGKIAQIFKMSCYIPVEPIEIARHSHQGLFFGYKSLETCIFVQVLNGFISQLLL